MTMKETILPRRCCNYIGSCILAAAFTLGTDCLRGQTYQNPIVVPTIDKLRALNALNVTNFPNDTIAMVIDYYAPSDSVGYYQNAGRGRGGGFFRWMTPTSSIPGSPPPAEDGGRWIFPNPPYNTNGVWERVLNGGTPNVKMWGAKGDFVHNDYMNIQNAVNACSFGWAMELLFPSGTYIVTNTIVFPNNLHIRGEGINNNATILMPTNVQKDIFRTRNADNALRGYPYDFEHGLLFEDLQLVFDGTQSTRNKGNAALVTCLAGEAYTIRHILTEGGGIGIRCLGGGAPGLRLRDVGTFDAAIAGVCVEPLPGQAYGVSDSLSFIGVSGDLKYTDSQATASLILFSNMVNSGSIEHIKCEGKYGGGVIRYQYPSACGNGAMAHLRIANSFVSVDPNGVPQDLVVLTGGPRGASLTLDQLSLYSVRYLVNDQIVGRCVEADTDVYTGLAQATARAPLMYESCTNATYPQYSFSKLVVGQTALSYLYATNAGWYRVMQPLPIGPKHLAGKLVISSYGRESTELQIDVTPGAGSPSIGVNRASYGSSTPVVTQARAFWYNDATLGTWAYVDVYVGNPFTSWYVPKEARITLALDINAVEVFDLGAIELISPILPVSPTLPPGAESNVVQVPTYR